MDEIVKNDCLRGRNPLREWKGKQQGSLAEKASATLFDYWWFCGVLTRRKRAKKEPGKYAKALEDAGFFSEAKRVLRITESLFAEREKT